MKFSLRIWILIFFLIFSVISIFGIPPLFLQKGVLVKAVERNSSSFEAGFREGQIITHINGEKVKNLEALNNYLNNIRSSNESKPIVFTTKDSEIVYFSDRPLLIAFGDLPSTKIKFGLDVIGGARALVKVENKTLSSEEAQDLVSVTETRFNEFGLKEINVKKVSDLDGNYFMLIEIAGATPKDLEDLISQQGKFEAKIGNKTIFEGGMNKDIASVCRRDASCAFIESCRRRETGFVCSFKFGVTLSGEAAKKHAEATKNLGVNITPQGRYLSLPLDLYLDDVLVDSLLISESLRGLPETQIQISGSATGETRELAIKAAEKEMNKLQTILITGSLPFKPKIVKLDNISPTLGKDFLRIILMAGLISLSVVALLIFLRYKKIKIVLAMLLTSFSEILIILGIAAFINWNLDLPSIAGILIVIGTGIDQQIIIMDEARSKTTMTLIQKIKRAFGIILGAYLTSVVAMFPLLWAGAGLLKGFAFTTIIGISIGILITRPAFTHILKIIEKDHISK
ncbi:MAG: site-2 protease family protein [Candidatus Pacearchaeota archaeon]